MAVGSVLLVAVLLVALVAGRWFVGVHHAAVRAYYQGRRDQLVGRIDRRRCDNDVHYETGVLDQYIRDAKARTGSGGIR